MRTKKVITTKHGVKQSFVGAYINVDVLDAAEEVQKKLIARGLVITETAAILRQGIELWVADMEATLEKLGDR